MKSGIAAPRSDNEDSFQFTSSHPIQQMSIGNNCRTTATACSGLNHLGFIIVNHHPAIGIFGLFDGKVMFLKQFTGDFISDFRKIAGNDQIVITRFNSQISNMRLNGVYRAGAIAAPILNGSLMPISITRPMVADVTTGPSPSMDTMAAPAPVTVYWAVGGFANRTRSDIGTVSPHRNHGRMSPPIQISPNRNLQG